MYFGFKCNFLSHKKKKITVCLSVCLGLCYLLIYLVWLGFSCTPRGTFPYNKLEIYLFCNVEYFYILISMDSSTITPPPSTQHNNSLMKMKIIYRDFYTYQVLTYGRFWSNMLDSTIIKTPRGSLIKSWMCH